MSIDNNLRTLNLMIEDMSKDSWTFKLWEDKLNALKANIATRPFEDKELEYQLNDTAKNLILIIKDLLEKVYEVSEAQNSKILQNLK